MIRLAVLAESEADAKAVHILTRGILGAETERTAGDWELPLGWPHIKDVARKAIRVCHERNLADGLVLVADSDDDPIHAADGGHLGGKADECRFCQLQNIARKAVESLRLTGGHRPPQVAIAIATPTIEAWYLCGRSSIANEEACLNALKAGNTSKALRLRLKKDVYGSDRVGRHKQFLRAVEEAERLCGDLAQLEHCFPRGFGTFAMQLRAWKSEW